MTFEVLLFYRYAPIADPEALVASTRDLCEELDLLGRILIAAEGINGTVSGEVENTRAFIDRFRTDPIAEDIEFKIEPADGHAFKRLSVKLRDEIVTLGLAEDQDVDPNKTTGKRLSPPEFLRALEEADDDVVILDGRNGYESALGHFRGALCPDVEHFRDFPNWIRENMSHLTDKKVLTYCTGGIRCEKLSGLLINEGFRDVSQLEGGIINYGQDEEARGKHFEGKCYVFDSRIATGVNSTETRSVVSSCDHCGQSCDRYVNCGYPPCNDQFFCCEFCEEKVGRFCSDSCASKQHSAISQPAAG